MEEGKINKNTYVVCNGFKRDEYVTNIARLMNNGHNKTIPVIDNYEELDLLQEQIKGKFKIGIRIAAEEEPKFEFYTSRLGIGYKDIVPFYRKQIQENKQVELKMLHFFINTGIRDTAYYWNELLKCMKVYIALKRECQPWTAWISVVVSQSKIHWPSNTITNTWLMRFWIKSKLLATKLK